MGAVFQNEETFDDVGSLELERQKICSILIVMILLGVSHTHECVEKTRLLLLRSEK